MFLLKKNSWNSLKMISEGRLSLYSRKTKLALHLILFELDSLGTRSKISGLPHIETGLHVFNHPQEKLYCGIKVIFIDVLQVKPVVAVELPDKPKLPTILKDGSSKQNGLISTMTSMPPQQPSNGNTPSSDNCRVINTQPAQEEVWPRERAQTLSELKKQRAAAKLLNHPLFNGHLGNGSTDSFTDAKTNSEDPRMPLVSSNGSAVYYTPASGDPPLLKLKQPIEEVQPKVRTCCCVS